MAKQHILVVDDDQKSLQVLEISLKKAGFLVTTADNGLEALEKAKTSIPELIISDVKMPKMNGYQFCKRIKDDPKLAKIPFIFLTSQRSVDDKVKGLELGVDDYLTKPIYIKELLARVRLLLQRREKESLEEVGAQRHFGGNLSDMGVVDLLQTLDIGRKTGVLYLTSPKNEAGVVYFKDGAVIDAIQGTIKGERAVYRLLGWGEGQFKIDFKDVNRESKIERGTQGLIMEGMRRIDEVERLAEQLPPLDTILIIDPQELLVQYPDKFPNKAGKILQLFDGKRTIMQVVDECGLDDLPALNIISKLYFQGLLKEFERGAPPPAIPQMPPQPPAGTAIPLAPAGGAPMSGPDDGAADEASSVSVHELLARSGLPSAPAQAAAPPLPAVPAPPLPAAKAASPKPLPRPVAEPESDIADLVAEAARPVIAEHPSVTSKAAASSKGGESSRVLEPPEPELVSSEKSSRGKTLALVAVLVIALLGGGGFAAWKMFAGNGAVDLAPLMERLSMNATVPLAALLQDLETGKAGPAKSPEVIAGRAKALLRLGVLEGLPQSKLAEADSILRSVSNAKQGEPIVQLAWAEYEIIKGDFEAARKRIAAVPAGGAPEIEAETAYLAGLASLREGKSLGQAIEQFRKASAIAPQNPAVQMALAEAFLKTSNPQDARAAAQKAASLSATSGDALALAARACNAMGDQNCAESSWQKAVSLVPQNPAIALGQAEFVWQEKKDRADASSKLLQIVNNPAWNQHAATRARAYFLLGEIAAAAGEREKARGYYEEVQRLDRNYPGLSGRLSNTAPRVAPAPPPAQAPTVSAAEKAEHYLKNGKYALAVESFKEAIAIRPGDDSLWAGLGMSYLQMDSTKPAQDAFEKCLKVNPNNATALRWLGQIYTSIGRKYAAIEAYKKFLATSPNHPDAPLVQALLRRLDK